MQFKSGRKSIIEMLDKEYESNGTPFQMRTDVNEDSVELKAETAKCRNGVKWNQID